MRLNGMCGVRHFAGNFVKKSETITTTTTATKPSRGVSPRALVDAGLTDEQARALRMRVGIAVPADSALGSKLDGLADAGRADVEARLLLMEGALLEALAADGVDAGDEAQPPRRSPPLDRARKSRIIEALKRKG